MWWGWVQLRIEYGLGGVQGQLERLLLTILWIFSHGQIFLVQPIVNLGPVGLKLPPHYSRS